MSPSNSPSIRRMPVTMSVPRKFAPTPRTVVAGGVVSSGGLGRVRNFIIGLPSLAAVCAVARGPRDAGRLPAFRMGALMKPRLRDYKMVYLFCSQVLQDTKRFQQAFEIRLAVVLEFNPTAL